MSDRGSQSAGGAVDAVHRYKSVLRHVLEARPSGTRQRIARALGKNRSFVSQISNPSYSTPIPARHVDMIMEICHFSPAERTDFLAAYALAHPDRLSTVDAQPRLRQHTIQLPDFGDKEKNRKADILIREFVLGLTELLGGSDTDSVDNQSQGRDRDEETDQRRRHGTEREP